MAGWLLSFARERSNAIVRGKPYPRRYSAVSWMVLPCLLVACGTRNNLPEKDPEQAGGSGGLSASSDEERSASVSLNEAGGATESVVDSEEGSNLEAGNESASGKNSTGAAPLGGGVSSGAESRDADATANAAGAGSVEGTAGTGGTAATGGTATTGGTAATGGTAGGGQGSSTSWGAGSGELMHEECTAMLDYDEPFFCQGVAECPASTQGVRCVDTGGETGCYCEGHLWKLTFDPPPPGDIPCDFADDFCSSSDAEFICDPDVRILDEENGVAIGTTSCEANAVVEGVQVTAQWDFDARCRKAGDYFSCLCARFANYPGNIALRALENEDVVEATGAAALACGFSLDEDDTTTIPLLGVEDPVAQTVLLGVRADSAECSFAVLYVGETQSITGRDVAMVRSSGVQCSDGDCDCQVDPNAFWLDGDITDRKDVPVDALPCLDYFESECGGSFD